MSAEPRLQILLTQDEIQTTVARLATEIKRDYEGKHPILIGILKGCFMFMADLTRRLDFPIQVEFVRTASYGKGTETSGRIRMVQGLRCPIAGRHVLVIEDIVDTGLTVSFLMQYLERKKPASLKLCALVEKPARRRVPVAIDYLGFTVPDRFLVGYGLDWDEKFRCLPDIHYVETE